MAARFWPGAPTPARRAAVGLAALLLVIAFPPRTAAREAARVVAVGDVHGDFDGFVSILQATGLIDADHRWAGGRATLVQTGDVSDRGDDVRAVMDLLRALEREAPRHGGRVVTLLGNHEVMVLLGDFSEVTPEICAAFADGRSERRREQAWRRHRTLASRQAGAFETPPPVYRLTRDQFFEQWPPGCLEYREALGPRGAYGAWLRERDAAALVEGTLYMHAGAGPDLPVTSVADLNTRVREELARFDRLTRELVRARLALPHFTLQEMIDVAIAQVEAANAVVAATREGGRARGGARLNVPAALAAAELLTLGQWWVAMPEGPMWYRGYALDPDEALDGPLTDLLSRLGATHLAVGHTVSDDGRIRVRGGGRLFLIDTGMLVRIYNGRPSALERLAGGRFTAVYLDRRVALTPEPEP